MRALPVDKIRFEPSPKRRFCSYFGIPYVLYLGLFVVVIIANHFQLLPPWPRICLYLCYFTKYQTWIQTNVFTTQVSRIMVNILTGPALAPLFSQCLIQHILQPFFEFLYKLIGFRGKNEEQKILAGSNAPGYRRFKLLSRQNGQFSNQTESLLSKLDVFEMKLNIFQI